jgi:hypothetical protein
MCTLTFIPTTHGYLAAMNRDELRNRLIARAPRTHTRNGVEALYPTEPSGGTWIACNRYAILLALLNWNDKSPSQKVPPPTRSRGLLIPELIGASNFEVTAGIFERWGLDGILPFRLVGFFASEKTVAEWSWDGRRKDLRTLPWSRGHWFSSSLSDRAAAEQRGIACEAAATRPNFGTRRSLRPLHASHLPAAGPFSVCVHRPDAVTVSYTEVVCRKRFLTMRYVPGNPCRKSQPRKISDMALDRDIPSKAA